MERSFDGFKLEGADAADAVTLIDNIFHAAGHGEARIDEQSPILIGLGGGLGKPFVFA